jgi:hypothetical protein
MTKPVRGFRECSECGGEKELYETARRVERFFCPDCEGDPRVDEVAHYRCCACWNICESTVAHHTSYDPERVVPMCLECHQKLHRDEVVLPHMTPDMSRQEAVDAGLVSIQDLTETDWEPAETDVVELW